MTWAGGAERSSMPSLTKRQPPVPHPVLAIRNSDKSGNIALAAPAARTWQSLVWQNWNISSAAFHSRQIICRYVCSTCSYCLILIKMGLQSSIMSMFNFCHVSMQVHRSLIRSRTANGLSLVLQIKEHEFEKRTSTLGCMYGISWLLSKFH